jgi:hypothetical protein
VPFFVSLHDNFIEGNLFNDSRSPTPWETQSPMYGYDAGDRGDGHDDGLCDDLELSKCAVVLSLRRRAKMQTEKMQMLCSPPKRLLLPPPQWSLPMTSQPFLFNKAKAVRIFMSFDSLCILLELMNLNFSNSLSASRSFEPNAKEHACNIKGACC